MSTVTVERDLDIRQHWFYYGWVNVVVAAVAMAATYPGRSHGLGMFTESLKADFGLTNTQYAQLNLWATLIGALFCLPIGGLVDRLGSRSVLTAIYVAFGAVVAGTSQASTWWELFGGLILTRGLGQSALSVVSITLVAKWFKGSRLAWAMACYTVLLGMCWGSVTKLISLALVDLNWDWRTTWIAMGLVLAVGLAPLSLLFARSAPKNNPSGAGADSVEPESLPDALKAGVTADDSRSPRRTDRLPLKTGDSDSPEQARNGELEGATLREALATPTFWVFSLAVSFYGLITAGISLFNEEIFKDNNIAREAYHSTLIIGSLTGIASQFLAAWLAGRWGIHRVLSLALGLLMLSLLALPFVQATWQAYLYGMAMAVSGGVIALVFFAAWGQAFGRREVGRIQGIAQMLTVVASALGPLLFGYCRDQTGSYAPVFYAMAPVAFILAAACWITPLPKKDM